MSDNQYQSEDHLTFSQRYGYEPLPEPMQLEELSDDLRREIWNATREFLESQIQPTSFQIVYFSKEAKRFIERVLGKFLKKPEDEIDTSYEKVINLLKDAILHGRFNKVLDLVKIMVNDRKYGEKLAKPIGESFEICAAAYYLDMSRCPYQFSPRSNEAQGEATQKSIKTIRDGGMEGAATHLRDAAAHINAQQFADSISDSIHAVESVARRIDPKSNTLGAALKALEKKGLLTNGQLKTGFEKIYTYTNNEEGIRHAQVFKDSPDVGLDEAMFMFGACASFAAYLVNKHHKMQEEDDE